MKINFKKTRLDIESVSYLHAIETDPEIKKDTKYR